VRDLTNKVDSVGPPTGQLTAAEWIDVAQELKNLIESYSAQTSSSGDLTQLSKAIAQFGNVSDYYTGGGTANAQTLTIVARPGAVAYVTGLRVRWKPTATNTGAATINVNGLGAQTITRFDGTVLQAGDIATGRYAEAWYEAGAFRLTNNSLSIPSPALPSGYITGLICGTSAADPSHDITFSVGQCRDATNSVNLILSSSLTKRFDGASIAVGTGQTGFPTATHPARDASTWYRVFIVGHVDGRVDFGFDTSTTAAFLRADLVTADVAGWNYYRQIGWVLTQSGDVNAFVPFSQHAEDPTVFSWVAHDTRFSPLGSLSATRQTRAVPLLCPPSAVAEVVVGLLDTSGSGTSERYLALTDTDHADIAPTNVLHTAGFFTRPGDSSWRTIPVRVNASSEFYERWSASGGGFERTIFVPRWRFAR